MAFILCYSLLEENIEGNNFILVTLEITYILLGEGITEN